MILLVHMLLGALIGQKIASPVLALILAFLSHYFLDFFPHVEYSIDNIRSKNWKKSLFDFSKALLDVLAGVAVISALSSNSLIIYACAFFAILPDGLTLLGSIFKNRLFDAHGDFHQKKSTFFKTQKNLHVLENFKPSCGCRPVCAYNLKLV